MSQLSPDAAEKVTNALTKAVLRSFAIIAFTLLTLSPYRTIGWVSAGVTLCAMAVLIVRFPAVDRPTVEQVLLLGAFLADFYRQPHSHLALGLLAAAGMVIMAAIVNGDTFTQATSQRRVLVANLPGFRGATKPPIPPKILTNAWTVLVVVVGVCALAKLPTWPVAVLAALVGLGSAATAGHSVLERLRFGRTQEYIRKAVIAYQPEFAFYFSAPMGSEYHVEMWMPYLERLGKRFILIVREDRAYDILMPQVKIPVLFCNSIGEVDNLVVPSMRTVFYANNGMKNVHMVRFGQLCHIQLLHGDSDKTSSFNPVTAMFDRVYVAGQAAIDRYAANDIFIDPEKFVVVGRPQVDAIDVVRTPISARETKTVLYATTWAGLYADTDYNSLGAIGTTIVACLLERGVTVIFRPHPLTRRSTRLQATAAEIEQMLADDKAKSGRDHVYGGTATATLSLFECFNRADALISDVSGVASDFLYSEKPFALTDMTGEGPQFATSSPLARAAYVIDSEGSNLANVLDDLIEADPLMATRAAMKTYYLGDFPDGDYASGFFRAALHDINRGKTTPEPALTLHLPEQTQTATAI